MLFAYSSEQAETEGRSAEKPRRNAKRSSVRLGAGGHKQVQAVTSSAVMSGYPFSTTAHRDRQRGLAQVSSVPLVRRKLGLWD